MSSSNVTIRTRGVNDRSGDVLGSDFWGNGDFGDDLLDLRMSDPVGICRVGESVMQ